jgi:hypothetical protein
MLKDFSRLSLPLSPTETENLRTDYNQGRLALIVPFLIILPFIWFFSKVVPQDTIWGKLFIWVPLLGLIGVTAVVIYHLNNNRLDLKSGEKILVKGIIKNKYIRSTGKLSGSTLRNLSDRMRHFIVLGGRSFLIDGAEYESCAEGEEVKMYVTPYSRRVLDFEVTSLNPDYSHFR